MGNKVTLKVLEAYTRDVGRGATRIDYNSMDKIEVQTGNFVKIYYDGKSTIAKVVPLYPSDEDKGIIRIDGLVRSNLDTKIGEDVEIEKIEVLPAQRVTVTPLEAIPPIDERYLSDALEGVGVQNGDNIMVPYFGGRLTFKVISTIPEGPVFVSTKSLFSITDEVYPQDPLIATIFNSLDKRKVEIIKEYKEKIAVENDPKVVESIMGQCTLLTDKIQTIKKYIHDVWVKPGKK